MSAATGNLAEALVAHARGDGERIALLADERPVSYRELESEAGRFARAFRAAGVSRTERVALCLPDGAELVAAFIGAAAAGAVPVVLSNRLDDESLAFVLADSGSRAFVASAERLAEGHALDLAGERAATVAVGGDAPGAERLDTWLPAGNEQLSIEPVAPHDMAYWLYTSGTTGRPKAVVHVHGDVEIASLHLERNLGLVPGERIFTTSKLFFAYALGHSLIGGLRAGATVVLDSGWPEAGRVARTVERARPHLLFSVPTLYRKLLDGGHAGEPGFRAVRHFVSAGEPLPLAVGERWRAETGQPILEGIGTSETTWLFVANTPTEHRPGSTGRVLPWAEARLVGEDGAEVTAPGEPGVLWVAMPSMFAEYWHEPERTRSVRDGDWYRTDDVFERDAEGWLYHRGRRGDLFKVSGQWVSPVEVEEAAFALPEVDEAAAAGCEGDDGLLHMVLFVVPHAAPAPGLGETIVARLREVLPHHKCPREVRFVDAIPRTTTGKVKRHELQATVAR